MTYKYSSKLREHELRLLYPVSVTYHRLEFKMVTVGRSSVPVYTALSYAWGTQNATEHIFLDGRPFPVRPNLWSCLFNLAGVMRNLYLWVDAICINQEDILEKSSQVKRMKDTYARADQVAVWLGLPSMYGIGRTQFSDSVTMKTYQVANFDWMDNMEDLARRDYWNRYWVIQEMLLGRDILIWCGDHPMPLDDFQSILCSHADIDQYSSSPRDWKSDHYPALPLIMGRHVDRYPEFRDTLGALLVRHRRSECKDLRDRVFAMIGIVDHEEAALLSRFFPDYSLSEREVVVIALAHITQVMTSAASFDFGHIGIHSEEIFEAFRIPNKKQRRKLLDDAESVDYIGSESVEGIRSQLSDHDFSYIPGSSAAISDNDSFTIADEDFFPRRQKSNCLIL